jgi:8-oxo-dGTP pyrophosphatase MutT (NUDIX family)
MRLMPKSSKSHLAVQFAALPWRIGASGVREVMLLTSRETRRWVIPKGWPMKGKKPSEVARQEAFEEAGLVGQVHGKQPIGRYQYEKKLKQRSVPCEVAVYLLQVERQLENWPERHERTTEWFEATEAAALVNEKSLTEIIEGFAGSSRRFVVYEKGQQRSKRLGKPVSLAD